MAPFEALYGRPCRSPVCWAEVGEKHLTSSDLIKEMTDKVQLIRQRLVTAQDRQKNYADNRRIPLEFSIGDHVLLKVRARTGSQRFGQKGKLAPRFIGPFEILERIGNVSYRLALPPQLARVHNVFHVSMLKKYLHDPRHVINWNNIELEEDITFLTRPISILDREDRALRNKVIPLVKVLWESHGVEGATWEREAKIRSKHPHHFE